MRWSQRLLSVAFIAAGILHFLRTETYESIMPGYLPAHRELVLVSGAAEIAGGLGMAIAGTRRAAGVWLVALLVAVFPANVNMAVNHLKLGDTDVPTWALWGRLPLQAVAIAWAWWFTRADRPDGGRLT